MSHRLRTLWPLGVIAVMAVLATINGAYILEQQRFRWPWKDVFTFSAEFTSAQAITPGQGQTVQVAGVDVGEISRVELEDGRAVVTMEIEPDELDRVYRDATLFVRPKTGLQDMTIQLDPGSPAAGEIEDGERIGIAQTTPQVTTDEVLGALDADTRAYLATLLDATGRGLRGRGPDLRAILRAGRPTLARTASVTAAVADRRRQLRRLVGNLRRIADATAGRSRELTALVDEGAATFGAVAEEEGALRDALGRLPGTLDAADDTLRAATPVAEELGPTLEALRPAVRQLAPTLQDVRPLLRDGVPALRQVRPLVREARPLVRDLRPTLQDLSRVTPALTRSFEVLTYVTNELAYNPPGPEEGYLFWLAWFNHNAVSILANEDAHGVAWRGLAYFSCSTLEGLDALAPAIALVLPLPTCPDNPAEGGGARRRGGDR